MGAGRAVEREILLAFWKIHILHHAGEEPVVGQWILRELRSHGYEVSPGTLYPLLARMQARGWLRCESDPRAGPRARKEYSLTREGRKVLALLRRQVTELYQEVVGVEAGGPSLPGTPRARSSSKGVRRGGAHR